MGSFLTRTKVHELKFYGSVSSTSISQNFDAFLENCVDFKIKHLTVGGKRLKLTIWDTAGQEKFRTLTSSYYRGAQGVILVYDVTRRETFTNLSDVWAKEVDLYSTSQDCVKMLVGNKVDRESERIVSREEGIALATEHGCLFLECSAKTRENVEQCFEELALKFPRNRSLFFQISVIKKKNAFIEYNLQKMHLHLIACPCAWLTYVTWKVKRFHARIGNAIMEVPSLLEEGSTVVKRNILKQKQEQSAHPGSGGCCL
ncbi:RAB GTPase homolog C2A [Actinidia rufa]|uniref:RAB GTPase homolog C2A n=1 Tax=Actinidia rufa TaxID=165716 RepID=A0A7J0F3P7_9ERIC|nr:RAB GTPase homolog C2A [Actinidia rufa]